MCQVPPTLQQLLDAMCVIVSRAQPATCTTTSSTPQSSLAQSQHQQSRVKLSSHLQLEGAAASAKELLSSSSQLRSLHLIHMGIGSNANVATLG